MAFSLYFCQAKQIYALYAHPTHNTHHAHNAHDAHNTHIPHDAHIFLLYAGLKEMIVALHGLFIPIDIVAYQPFH